MTKDEIFRIHQAYAYLFRVRKLWREKNYRGRKWSEESRLNWNIHEITPFGTWEYVRTMRDIGSVELLLERKRWNAWQRAERWRRRHLYE